MFLVTASLMLFLAQSAPQQSSNNLCGDISTVDAFGVKTAADARSFLARIKIAIAQDDRDTVAKIVKYPLRVQLNGHTVLLKNRSSFLQNYNAVFTPAVRTAIRTQSATCLAYASSGYTPEHGSAISFTIGQHGEVWFNSETESGPFKIITVNNDSSQ